MSRILEFQHADEQTVAARVLLELHQAIDLHFPQAGGSSRQFSKTVLATQEGTSTENQPAVAAMTAGGAAVAAPAVTDAPKSIPAKPTNNNKNTGHGLEFSKHNAIAESITATMLQEAGWSRWLTRILILTLFVGTVLLAWIYMFGVPRV